MSSLLPSNPSIERVKKEAQALCKRCKAGNDGAIQRVRQSLALFLFQSDSQIAETIKLSHAQDVTARKYGFATWSALAVYAAAERENYRAMSQAIADECMADLTFRSGVARAKGLPEIGTSRVSEHGVRYDVTDYAPARADDHVGKAVRLRKRRGLTAGTNGGRRVLRATPPEEGTIGARETTELHGRRRVILEPRGVRATDGR